MVSCFYDLILGLIKISGFAANALCFILTTKSILCAKLHASPALAPYEPLCLIHPASSFAELKMYGISRKPLLPSLDGKNNGRHSFFTDN